MPAQLPLGDRRSPSSTSSPPSTLKLCVAYEADGNRYEHVPYHQSVLHNATSGLQELPGWGSDLAGATAVEDLPPAARAYLELIATEAGVPVTYAGVGPGREQYVSFAA